MCIVDGQARATELRAAAVLLCEGIDNLQRAAVHIAERNVLVVLRRSDFVATGFAIHLVVALVGRSAIGVVVENDACNRLAACLYIK